MVMTEILVGLVGSVVGFTLGTGTEFALGVGLLTGITANWLFTKLKKEDKEDNQEEEEEQPQEEEDMAEQVGERKEMENNSSGPMELSKEDTNTSSTTTSVLPNGSGSILQSIKILKKGYDKKLSLESTAPLEIIPDPPSSPLSKTSD